MKTNSQISEVYVQYEDDNDQTDKYIDQVKNNVGTRDNSFVQSRVNQDPFSNQSRKNTITGLNLEIEGEFNLPSMMQNSQLELPGDVINPPLGSFSVS